MQASISPGLNEKAYEKNIQITCLSTQCQKGQSSNLPAENERAENETILRKQMGFCFYARE